MTRPRPITDRLLGAFDLPNATPPLLRLAGLDVLGDTKQAHNNRRKLKLTTAVLRRAIADIDAAFNQDLPFILLKGEPLEILLFNGEYARGTGDIDLLILPGDIECANRRLQSLGYRRKRDEDPRMWAHNQEPWVHQTHGVVVETHWSPAVPGVPPLPLHELFATCVGFEFQNGFEVDVLRPDWLFLHLALHFHHHTSFAKGLLDIAGWCDQQAEHVDCDELLDRTRRLRLFGLVQWPLHTIARLTGIEPPLYCDDVDPTVRAWAAASSAAMKNCLSHPPANNLEASLVATMSQVSTVPSLTLQALSMLILDGWTAKLQGFLRPYLLGPHRLGRCLAGKSKGFTAKAAKGKNTLNGKRFN